jgi:hypothetical protein
MHVLRNDTEFSVWFLLRYITVYVRVSFGDLADLIYSVYCETALK